MLDALLVGALGALIAVFLERFLFRPADTIDALARSARLARGVFRRDLDQRCPQCGHRDEGKVDVIPLTDSNRRHHGIDPDYLIEIHYCSHCNEEWSVERSID